MLCHGELGQTYLDIWSLKKNGNIEINTLACTSWGIQAPETKAMQS